LRPNAVTDTLRAAASPCPAASRQPISCWHDLRYRRAPHGPAREGFPVTEFVKVSVPLTCSSILTRSPFLTYKNREVNVIEYRSIT
jgi:hypothetical protein